MYFRLMTNTSFVTTQEKLTQTARHGYAVFSGDVMISWTIDARLGLKVPGATRLVNVQNGAYLEVENGAVVANVFADEIPAAR